MLNINYDRLLLGGDVPIKEGVSVHIPKLNDLINEEAANFSLFTRIFTTSVREQFSGIPEKVDEIEEAFPTFWDIAFDDDMNIAIGKDMYGDGIDLLSVIVGGLSWWTKIPDDEFKPLSNHKIVVESVDWVLDKEGFVEFCQLIQAITLMGPNEDLIAPKGISKKPMSARIWKKVYNGRVRNLQKQPGQSLGDKVLLLQALSRSYIPFNEIREMTYYQFSNLLKALQGSYQDERQFGIFVSGNFDTKDMKLEDLSNVVAMTKLKK